VISENKYPVSVHRHRLEAYAAFPGYSFLKITLKMQHSSWNLFPAPNPFSYQTAFKVRGMPLFFNREKHGQHE